MPDEQYKTRRAKEKSRLCRLPDARVDHHPEKVGVLLRDAIRLYAEAEDVKMITPFNPENLKPAGYELTVGDEAMRGGEHIYLDGVDKELEIPPFEVAVVKTGETVNLPRYIIARWNIRVKWAYQGLLWVGGPQVDPGYVGHLFCPIYNLSNTPVKLRKGKAIALMDFVKTSGFEENGPKEGEEYPRPPKRILMEDYAVDEFESALFAQNREMKTELLKVKNKMELFSTLVFVVLSILMSLVALRYSSGDNLRFGLGILNSLTVAAAFFAVLIALFQWWALPKHAGKGWSQQRWLQLVFAAIVAAIIGVLAYCWVAGSPIEASRYR